LTGTLNRVDAAPKRRPGPRRTLLLRASAPGRHSASALASPRSSRTVSGLVGCAWNQLSRSSRSSLFRRSSSVSTLCRGTTPRPFPAWCGTG